MKNTEQLINNVIGQLNGIKKMINDEKECFEVLTQLKAAKSGLKGITNKVLKESFLKCIEKCEKSNQNDLCDKYFKEILNNN